MVQHTVHMVWVSPVFKQIEQIREPRIDKRRKRKKQKSTHKKLFRLTLKEGFNMEIGNTQRQTCPPETIQSRESGQCSHAILKWPCSLIVFTTG